MLGVIVEVVEMLTKFVELAFGGVLVSVPMPMCQQVRSKFLSIVTCERNGSGNQIEIVGVKMAQLSKQLVLHRIFLSFDLFEVSTTSGINHASINPMTVAKFEIEVYLVERNFPDQFHLVSQSKFGGSREGCTTHSTT